jgi:hypothetical protein
MTGTGYSVMKTEKLCNFTVNKRYTEYLNTEDEVYRDNLCFVNISYFE